MATTNYKEITCFKTFDNQLFENQDNARSHADNILGEELDGLLKMFNIDITPSQSYKALMALLNNRKELKKSINLIHSILNFEGGHDE